MKNLTQYINEYLIKKKIDKVRDNKTQILYTPKDRSELVQTISKLLKEGQTNLNCIDVSNITKMDYLFNNFTSFNGDISEWNVSKVENMNGIFMNCENFEGWQIENWNTDSLVYANSMFYNCEKFDCNLSNWNTSNIKYSKEMFRYCENFKGKGLENWNTSNLKETYCMFEKCYDFDCNLSNWNMSNVTDMGSMFEDCKSFKGKGLENWDVSKAKSISVMFYNCENFNCDLEKWNLNEYCGKVKTFYGCKSLKNTPSWYTE